MGVIGIDEVGRGSWAGPLLVVAAVCDGNLPRSLKDSKQLTRKQRDDLFDVIINNCRFGEGWVQPEEIDTYGLTQAMRIGASRALLSLSPALEAEIIMDGHINYCPEEYANVRCIVGADASEPIVSAASVYAKVLRDRHMIRLADLYPAYGFEDHVGYGTEFHQLMLKVYGPSRIHRTSYKPVNEVIVSSL